MRGGAWSRHLRGVAWIQGTQGGALRAVLLPLNHCHASHLSRILYTLAGKACQGYFRLRFQIIEPGG